MRSVGELVQDIQQYNLAAADQLFTPVREPYAGPVGLHDGICRTEGFTDVTIGATGITIDRRRGYPHIRDIELGPTGRLVQQNGQVEVNISESATGVGLGIRLGAGILHLNVTDSTVVALHDPCKHPRLEGMIAHPENATTENARIFVPQNRSRDHSPWATSAIGVHSINYLAVANTSPAFQGYNVFNNALGHIIRYAALGSSKDTLTQLRHPDQEVKLPTISASPAQGRESLSLQSKEDDTHIIRYTSAPDEYGKPRIVHLLLQEDGRVDLAPDSIDNFMTCNDADYGRHIADIGKKLDDYLKQALGETESANVKRHSQDFIAGGVLSLRRELGNHTFQWRARREVRRLIPDSQPRY